MSHAFSHPASAALLQRVAHHLQKGSLFLVPNHHFLFICGGPMEGTKTHFRKIFLDFIRHQTSEDYRVFLAENAAQDVIDPYEPRLLDLSEFESFIATVADCIVIFTESPGSFAELGLFSASEDIAKKMSRCC